MSLARVIFDRTTVSINFVTEIPNSPCGEAEKLVWQSFRGSGPWNLMNLGKNERVWDRRGTPVQPCFVGSATGSL